MSGKSLTTLYPALIWVLTSEILFIFCANDAAAPRWIPMLRMDCSESQLRVLTYSIYDYCTLGLCILTELARVILLCR